MGSNRRYGYTLLEIMIVILVISVLLGIAIPQFMTSRSKAQARSCQSNLRQIMQAKEQFAMSHGLQEGGFVADSDIEPYLKGQPFPVCPASGTYSVKLVGENPTCSLAGNNPPHALP